MPGFTSGENKYDLKQLLLQYRNLRDGTSNSFLDEDSFEIIINYFDEKDKLAAAHEAVEIGIGQHPYSAALLFKKADLLIVSRKYKEALTVLDQAAILDSTDINLYILKTDVFLALDQPERAVELLGDGLDRFEGEEKIELLFELSDVYDDYEEFDKVFDCLKMILEQEPENEEALYKICFWTDFTHRNEEGIALHQKIIDEFPYNELAWFNLASALQGLKLYEKAIDAYKYALVIDEKFDYAYRNMGDAYIRLRKYREAIEALEKVLELSRPEEVIYEAIGHCYDRLKNPAQARFYYRKASHLNPDNSRMYYKIAATYMNEHQWRSAIKQLETALKINRHQAEYNQAIAECYSAMEDYREAVHHYTAALMVRPKSYRTWQSFIRCLYDGGYYDEANEQVHAALAATGRRPVFLYYLAAILFALGRPKEALLQLEHAMETSPASLKYLLELNPALLQHQQVVDVVARYKKKRRM
jgi:tetratricopeptide (TPR) repeat protein